MSIFPDPVPHSIGTRYQVPNKISDTVYEFPLISEGHDYLWNLCFRTHPLLLDRSGNIDRYRLSAADADYAQLLVSNRLTHEYRSVCTIPNTYHDEPVVTSSQMGGIYSADIDFFHGEPIVTALLDHDPILRVVFWREPVAPFWITYNLGDSPTYFGANWFRSPGLALTVRSYDGALTYRWGILST